VSLPAKNIFNPAFPISEKDGHASQVFRDYMTALDRLVASIVVGNFASPINVAALTNAANDVAAAAAGVAIGQLYRNGSVIQVRIV
jgi:hypothetical protein